MFRLVSLLGIAAVAVAAIHAAARSALEPRESDDTTDDRLCNQRLRLAAAPPFHAPFSLN